MIRGEWQRAALPGVVLGAAVRTVYVATKWSEPLLLNDSLYYSDQAAQLVRGDWFHEFLSDEPGAEHGPLTSVLLAPVSWMDVRVPWQRVVTALVGLLAVALIARLAWRVGGTRLTVVAGVVAAVYPNLWVSDGLVMSEPVSVCVLSLLLNAAVGPAPWGVRRSVAVGVLIGLCALARSELVLLAPLVLWFVWRNGLRHGRDRRVHLALVAGATALTLLPWVTFNLVRFEEPVLLTTNDGAALLGTYCPEVLQTDQIGTWSLFCVLHAPNITDQMDSSQRSVEYRRQGLAHARQQLDRLPLAVVARVARVLDVWGLNDQLRQDVGEERPRWVGWAGIVSFWVLAPLAVWGWRHVPGNHRRWMLMPCAVVLAATVVYYGGHRIRSSAEPTMVVAASAAMVALYDRYRVRQIRPATSSEA
jgi:hypothetical protein